MKLVKNIFHYVRDYSKYVDFTILFVYIILSLIGLIMIYSASMVIGAHEAHGDPAFYARGQLRYLVLGFMIVFFMAYLMSGKMLKDRRLHICLIFIVLFFLVITHFFGVEVNGERRWLEVPLIGRFQPSEFFKIVIILYLAYIYDKKNEQLSTLKKENFFPIVLVGGISCFVLFNDFGTWLVSVAIIISMFIYSGTPMKIMMKVGAFVAVVILAVVGMRFLFTGEILSGYQQARIESYLNPFADSSGASYQLTHSLISISHGGVTGNGLGESIMKLGYLPEPHTDFIFAVIAEELGLVGVIIILVFFMVLVFKALYYAHISTDKFYSLLCIGIAVYISVQVFINLGGISRLIPLTGVPLPFLSQGGSAFLSISLATGLLLIAAKHVKKGKEAH